VSCKSISSKLVGRVLLLTFAGVLLGCTSESTTAPTANEPAAVTTKPQVDTNARETRTHARPPQNAEVDSIANTTTKPKSDWIDLLATVDLEKSVIDGQWHRATDGIVMDKRFATSRLQLTNEVLSYDVETTFVRTDGSDMLCLIMPVGGSHAMLQIYDSSRQYARSGLDPIDGKSASENSTGFVADIRAGQPYTLRASVRRARTEWLIVVCLNDQEVVRWQGHETALATSPAWQISKDRAFAIGGFDVAVMFKSFRVRPSSLDIADTRNATPKAETKAADTSGATPKTEVTVAKQKADLPAAHAVGVAASGPTKSEPVGPTASSEPIPGAAQKALLDRIDSILADKRPTSAQKTVALREEIDNFVAKYKGHTFSLCYDITNVEEGSGRGMRVVATDTGQTYTIVFELTKQGRGIECNDSLVWDWEVFQYGFRLPPELRLPEKELLAIGKRTHYLVVTGTLMGKGRTSGRPFDLSYENITAKVIPASKATGKLKKGTAKP
jgi:hypothetical protein